MHLLQPSARSHAPDSTLLREGVGEALKPLEGRWKLVILFHLFGVRVLRFSDLERAIPAVSQKMLILQLRQMGHDGIVHRIGHHQVPPKVEYELTEWGQALCAALNALLTWATEEMLPSDRAFSGADAEDPRGKG
jgi:DNA-binding HxlR family transcriptional regulator